ncbi:MAG: hypothetical protein ACE361_08895 [Aureliella sp.]
MADKDPNAGADVNAPRPKPNVRWQCGYTGMGAKCFHGPTEDGRCCFNGAENKDTELVARSDDGPMCGVGCPASTDCDLAKQCHGSGDTCDAIVERMGPCIPQRSNWFFRQNLATNFGILAGGLLLLLMAVPQKEAVFVPGTLSRKHSQILGNKLISERCSLCHPNSHPDAPAGLLQDELCMSCHESTMPDAVHRSAHDLNPEQLARIQTQTDVSLNGRTKLVSATLGRANSESKTTCAECHVEHHGNSHDLKAITNQRCQACHQEQFHSFSQGHPQFENYPYRTRRTIAFDHTAHAAKYFGQKNETFDCKRCHLDQGKAGAVGNVFRSVGFEAACASCHDETIRSETVNGWALLQMPCIDPSDRASDRQLESWPDTATFGYDGEISSAMRVLLAADVEAAYGLSVLPASNRIAEMDKSVRSEAARSLAKSFRKLVVDTARDGQAAWTKRLTQVAEKALARELDQRERALIDRMSQGLPPDLLRQIQQEWLGNPNNLASAEESEKSRAAIRLTSSPQTVISQEARDDDSLGGLLDESDDLDALLMEGLSGGGPTTTPGQEEQLGGPLLAEESDGGIDLDSDDALGGSESDDALLMGGWNDDGENSDDDLLGSPGSDMLGASAEDSGAQSVSTAAPLPKLEGSEHVRQGGWYLDRDVLTLNYMPTGHADPILEAWTEYIAMLETANATTALGEQPWLHPNQELGAIVPGSCTECHLVGSATSDQVDVTQWRAQQRPNSVRLFTKFDHTPHLSIPTVNDCKYCHRINGLEEALDGKIDSESISKLKTLMASTAEERLTEEQSRYVHMLTRVQQCTHDEFSPMQRADCIACHRPGAANDGCTQCHNYHVGTQGFEFSH